MSNRLRWGIGALLVLHGAIHLLGFLSTFDLARFEQLGAPTLLPSGLEPGDPLLLAFGLVWLVAFLAFVIAGAGVVTQASWAWTVTGIAAGISLAATVVWWRDAWIGAAVSAVVLVVAVVVHRRGDATLDRGHRAGAMEGSR